MAIKWTAKDKWKMQHQLNRMLMPRTRPIIRWDGIYGVWRYHPGREEEWTISSSDLSELVHFVYNGACISNA